jgi:hypothetical protein
MFELGRIFKGNNTLQHLSKLEASFENIPLKILNHLTILSTFVAA